MQSVSGCDKMSNKRKASDVAEEEEVAEKRARRRRRSRSEPRNTGSESQRRDTMHRLFGKFCSEEGEFESDDSGSDGEQAPYVEDPLLLDLVPECMDPEQLGFLLCAQETLRFLRQTGMSFQSKVYVTLRSRFLKAMKDLGIA